MKSGSFWAVLGAIILGMPVGPLIGRYCPYVLPSLDMGGKLFLNALMCLVLPLVASSIICGIAKATKEASFKRLGLKAALCFLSINITAILVGWFFFSLFAPHFPAASLPVQELPKSLTIQDIILPMIPSNLFEALAKGHVMPIILFSLLLGFAIGKTRADALERFFEELYKVLMSIVHLVLKALPFGVFALVVKQFATLDLATLRSLVLFLGCALSALLTFDLIILPPYLRVFGGIKNPYSVLKTMFPAIGGAFVTTSSSACLPITLDCLENRLFVPSTICRFSIPVGNSLNMAGSALFAYIATSFVILSHGVHLSFLTQFLLVFLTLLCSLGIAGVPSACLIAVMILLQTLGYAKEGIALFIAVDRILDMFRAATNVCSNTTSCLLISESEREFQKKAV